MLEMHCVPCFLIDKDNYGSKTTLPAIDTSVVHFSSFSDCSTIDWKTSGPTNALQLDRHTVSDLLPYIVWKSR